ncbi:unnamed protein product, partial [marine sediment metagenome]
TENQSRVESCTDFGHRFFLGLTIAETVRMNPKITTTMPAISEI